MVHSYEQKFKHAVYWFGNSWIFFFFNCGNFEKTKIILHDVNQVLLITKQKYQRDGYVKCAILRHDIGDLHSLMFVEVLLIDVHVRIIGGRVRSTGLLRY